jgi:F-type H+-transporting ATPase subunit alpha
LKNVPVNKVKKSFEKDFLEFLNAKHRPTLDALKQVSVDEITDVIQSVAKEVQQKYN